MKNVYTVIMSLMFQDLPLVELKRRCLEQLTVMSRKRITRIIAGNKRWFWRGGGGYTGLLLSGCRSPKFVLCLTPKVKVVEPYNSITPG